MKYQILNYEYLKKLRQLWKLSKIFPFIFLLFFVFINNGECFIGKKIKDQTGKRQLKILDLVVNSHKISKLEKYEVTFKLNKTYENPFNPDQIDIYGIFTSPSEKKIKLNGFFFQAIRLTYDGRYEKIKFPVWKIRFAPREIGEYTFQVFAQDRTEKTRSKIESFQCVSSNNKGFVIVSKRNPSYLEFETGEPYIPIGFNLFERIRLGKPLKKGRLLRYEKYMSNLSNNGVNFIRLRMDSRWGAIELPYDKALGYSGIGRYHQGLCWEADKVFEIAKERGLYIMLVLHNANSTVNQTHYKKQNLINKYRQWTGYDPYFEGNGGPCKKHDDFWDNQEARRYFRNKLRYIVARWGWSPNLLCWELLNEFHFDLKNLETISSWHQIMTQYLRSIDPNSHLISTSGATNPGEMIRNPGIMKSIYSLDEIDINQIHIYNRPDIPKTLKYAYLAFGKGYGKPFFFGEYGIKGARKLDLDRYLHDGLWAPMFSGACGPGAFWHIESYVEPLTLRSHYKHFADFVKQIPWNSSELHPADQEEVEVDTPRCRAFALKTDSAVYMWLNNKQSIVGRKEIIMPVKGARIRITDLVDGDYQVTWWNTWKGGVIRQETVRANHGGVLIKAPQIVYDIACIMIKK